MKSNAKDKIRMFSFIDGWSKSNQSQKEYCKQHQVGYHVFHYWYKLWKDEKQSTSIHSDFIPVKVSSEQVNGMEPGGKTTEIIFPDGTRVVFYQPLDANYIRSVVS